MSYSSVPLTDLEQYLHGHAGTVTIANSSELI